MRRPVLMAAALAAAVAGAAAARDGEPAPPRPAWLEQYREPASRLIGAALADTAAWDRLAEMTDTFGHRLSGSRALEDAIDWAVAGMRRDGLENVRREKVMVPHWVRGQERAELVGATLRIRSRIGQGTRITVEVRFSPSSPVA